MNRGWVAQLVEHRSVNYPWGLIDPDQEKRAAEFFPWQQVSPEEYAAHNAHTILVFSYSLYRFNSPDLQIWMHRLAEILHSEDLLRQARDRFLTTERRAEIEAHIDAQNAEFDRWLEESEEDEP